MIKYVLFITLLPPLCYAMENPERPRYHINNKIIFKQEMHESGDQEFQTVSDFNKEITKEIAIQKAQSEQDKVAIIESSMSNRTKVFIGTFAGCSSIIAAIITGLATYYSAKC